MKREIKFRAWDKINERWVFLEFSSFNFGSEVIFQGLEIDVDTICQFTGLKDKNGKDIYEGDIILCKDTYGEDEREFYVEWDADYSGFRPLHITNDEYDDRIYDYNKIEIIGNIYENPEL